jgi:hypothetical protein
MFGKSWKVYGLAVLFALVVCFSTRAQDKKPDKTPRAEEFKSKKYEVKEKGNARVPLVFQAGKTYTLIVESTGKPDVNLFVMDADKKAVAKDDSPGPDCKISFKPEKTGTYTLEIRNLGPGNTTSTLKVEVGK